MHFVVTGGAGFIGNNIVRGLIHDGHDVSVIDNLNTGKLANLELVKNQIKFFEVDIRDFDKVNEVVKETDGIFHQAALTVVQDSYVKRDEYFDVNVTGTENIFRSAKENKLKVVYASSSSIYGNVTKIPIKEDFQRIPINPYGETKLQAELLAEKFWKEGVEIIGLRYFNVYGKGQNRSYAGVITKFLDKIDNNENLEIFGVGAQVRDFIFVEDVARANISAMISKVKNGFFNVGTGEKISIEELGKMMIKISKSTLNLKYIAPLDGDVNLSQADKELSKKLLGWESKKRLQSWLKDIFQSDTGHGK